MGACPDLPREPVAVQPWTMSLHLPTVAARLAAVDPEVRSLEEEPRFRMGPGMEGGFVPLPSPMMQGLLERPCFTRGDGAEAWTAVHRQLLGSWDVSLRLPSYDRLVGVEWRLWAANGPCPPVVMWPRHSGLAPHWEKIVVLASHSAHRLGAIELCTKCALSLMCVSESCTICYIPMNLECAQPDLVERGVLG